MSKGKGSGIVASLLFLIMGALPLAAEAQQDLWPPVGGEVLKADKGKAQFNVSLFSRFSLITGTLDPLVPLDYDDIFGSGIGVGIEGNALWEIDPGFRIGPYLSIGWDTYKGERDVDAYGDSLEPEDLSITTVLVGVRGQYAFGTGFHVEAHMGFGVANNDSVDGVLTLSSIPYDVEVFKSTSAFAFYMGSRIRYGYKQFFAELGFGLRFQGAPDNGDLDFDSDPPTIVALELAVGLRF